MKRIPVRACKSWPLYTGGLHSRLDCTFHYPREQDQHEYMTFRQHRNAAIFCNSRMKRRSPRSTSPGYRRRKPALRSLATEGSLPGLAHLVAIRLQKHYSESQYFLKSSASQLTPIWPIRGDYPSQLTELADWVLYSHSQQATPAPRGRQVGII